MGVRKLPISQGDLMRFCVDCVKPCRGETPEGYCLDADRVEIERRVARTVGKETTVTTAVSDYERFLAGKRTQVPVTGFAVDLLALNPQLFAWQREIVRWALQRGRAAIWADCGLGKSAMQLEWAHHVNLHTGKPILILAPLAVSQQMVREGEKFGIVVNRCRSQADVRPGINITNYEMLGHFEPHGFGGFVLDESSRLKGDGPTCVAAIAFGREIPYRLACTATPAPNDTEELGNHAEFLGVMRADEMLSLYFAQDGNSTHDWRLKGHAVRPFWEWVAGWAVALRKPSDLGHRDTGFDLPELCLYQHTVEAAMPSDALFQAEARGIQEQRRVRRETLDARVALCAELVRENPGPWLLWCGLNDESKALTAAIPGAVEITGSDRPEHKEQAVLDFLEGKTRVLVSKPSIIGFGLNLQHCHQMAFVGLGDSYEAYYQAIRRCHRFGQEHPVRVHVIVSEADGPVVRNIRRKEGDAREMMDQLIGEMRDLSAVAAVRDEMDYREDVAHGRDWSLYLGDSIKRVREVPDESVGLVLFSPPFPSMYTYTNSVHDIGNCATFNGMLEHFRYLIPELLRVTLPGRSCVIHLTQSVAFIGKDGYSGIKDFRGQVIREMEAAGWIYYGENTIDKNPQLKAIRTKDRGLLFKTLATDASHMHMALADHMLQFRKPGTNPVPIRAGISSKYGNPQGWITQEEWIRWARPVWYGADFAPDGDGIAEPDVLNVSAARDTEDERHLCPLQLGVIRRCVKLWTNPLGAEYRLPDVSSDLWTAGATLLSPFAGIGSEIFGAVELGRRGIGFELKESYWRQALKNCKAAETKRGQQSFAGLFEGL
jgi:hypothetical protein